MSFGGDPRMHPDDHPTRREAELDEAEARGARTFSDPRDLCLGCARPLGPGDGCVWRGSRWHDECRERAERFDATAEAFRGEHSVTDAQRDGWGDYDLEDADAA